MLKGWEDKTHNQPKSKADRDTEEDWVTDKFIAGLCFYSFGQISRREKKDQQETIKHQELSHSFLFPSTHSNAISHLTPSPILHLMIPNVANSTSIMHAKPWLSLQWLNLTTSRSADVIAGRCGGREAWTTPPCKGYLWYTDPGAPASCRVHARRRYSAENRTKWCMCGDHCQRRSYDNRGQSVSQSEKLENKKGFSFSTFIFINIPSSYTDNHCQCLTWSLVSLQLLPEGSATRSSPFDKCSVIAVPLNTILVFH